MKTLLAIYIVSIIISFLICLYDEKQLGIKITVGYFISEYGWSIFLPIFNTLFVIAITLITISIKFVKLIKLDLLWNKIKDIEL
jgi:hypothetical protein